MPSTNEPPSENESMLLQAGFHFDTTFGGWLKEIPITDGRMGAHKVAISGQSAEYMKPEALKLYIKRILQQP